MESRILVVLASSENSNSDEKHKRTSKNSGDTKNAKYNLFSVQNKLTRTNPSGVSIETLK